MTERPRPRSEPITNLFGSRRNTTIFAVIVMLSLGGGAGGWVATANNFVRADVQAEKEFAQKERDERQNKEIEDLRNLQLETLSAMRELISRLPVPPRRSR